MPVSNIERQLSELREYSEEKLGFPVVARYDARERLPWSVGKRKPFEWNQAYLAALGTFESIARGRTADECYKEVVKIKQLTK